MHCRACIFRKNVNENGQTSLLCAMHTTNKKYGDISFNVTMDNYVFIIFVVLH